MSIEAKFEAGQKVRMTDFIIASAPAYAKRKYEIVAKHCAWEIGHTTWGGDFTIRNIETGDTAISNQRCLVLSI